jgi:hypothetical protein
LNGELIENATRLLKGEIDLPGLANDEVRERLLAGFRFILVDEYQDIDEAQYELISALAGRTQPDSENKLAILAVGDDDQNIYSSFRHTNVRFIRQFQEDYQAKLYHLIENYRSTAHIISAANCLIAHNGERMKVAHPITINHGRRPLPPGGSWESLDPVAKGKVGSFLYERQVEHAALPDPAIMDRRYTVLGMRDIDLGFAGRKSPENAIHRHLTDLKSGSFLRMENADEDIWLVDGNGFRVARLSKAASLEWKERRSRVQTIKVLAMVQWRQNDSDEEFSRHYRCEKWEVPLVEITWSDL